MPELRGMASSGGTRSLHPAPQETQFDDGPSRRRRRQLFVTTPLSMSLRLTPEQFVIFKAFHLNDLNTGARRFTAPVLLPDMSIDQRICSIEGEVGWSAPQRSKYIVTFTLVVQDW
ncbi:hypothetical protein ASF59_10990 [Methylobacterium sp. Leaf121]|nr:hypothetical protein ASF59_10990 [Methylobacterium sp. Leaf121]